MLDVEHRAALRLFNGFYEGEPALVVDLFGRSLVIFISRLHNETINAVVHFYRAALPGIQCVMIKERDGSHPSDRRGTLLPGSRQPDGSIQEDGVQYAIDLQLNQDASFYLDTRTLRSWAKTNLAGKTVLNTFAYTGSLGVAARAGGARRVVNTDRNPRCLELARKSYSLNAFSIQPGEFITEDFFTVSSRLRRSGASYDCVFLDPPFFSSTARGQVNLLNESSRLINKVRPLVSDNGWLVAINNALFLSGADYLRSLEALCSDGFMTIEKLLPVPEDITGFPSTIRRSPPIDPAPFNHPTKIAILRVRKKSGVE